MSIEPERLLGHYSLGEKIGAGGMGVVYRAFNTHLQLEVAIKLLPADLLTQPAARRRFRKEALAISRASHPNIAVVHDFDTQDGCDFLVMEYVPGMTLQERLVRGPMEEREILKLAAQLASALHAAHEKDVTHCDIKPANLRVTPEGNLKVLDFGLAHFRQAVTTTMTTSSGSAPSFGGTPPYMAPEQFEGDRVDARTDIYGAGTVLYEMATGRRPFGDAKSQARLIHSILHEMPPPPRGLNSRISVELERITLKCLDKDPALRYQTGRELWIDLERLQSPSIRAARPVRTRWHRHRAGAVVAALVLVGTVTLFMLLRPKSPPTTQDIPMQMMPLVTWPGIEWGGSISPDGKWIAFGASHQGRQGLWLVNESGGEPRLVVQTPGAIEAQAWSPTSEEIAYFSPNDDGVSLHVVSAFVGSQRKSLQLERSFAFAGLIRWTGTSLYLDAQRRGLWRLDLTTDRLELVLPAETPDGPRRNFDVCGSDVVYLLGSHGLCTTDLERQRPEEWTPHESAAFWARWVGPGCRQLVYSSNRSGQTDLWRLRLDTGRSTQITFSAGAKQIADASADGTRILFHLTEERGEIWRMRPGAAAQPLQVQGLSLACPSVSASGSRVAFQRAKPLQESAPNLLDAQILLADLTSEGLTPSQVVVPDGGYPRLSPDGRWLAYVRPSADTNYQLWLMDCNSRNTRCITPRFRVPSYTMMPLDWLQTTLAWSVSGQQLYFVGRTESGAQEIRVVAVGDSGATESELVVAASESAVYGDLCGSPDGQWLAYSRRVRQERELWEIRRRNLRNGEDRVLSTRTGMPGELLLLARGWMPNSAAVVVLDADVGLTGAGRTEVVEIDIAGRKRSLGVLERAFPGSARFDRQAAMLYVTCEDTADRPHNLFALSAGDGTCRRLTDNVIPGISFCGVEVLDDGGLVFTQQEQVEDLWLIRSKP